MSDPLRPRGRRIARFLCWLFDHEWRSAGAHYRFCLRCEETQRWWS